MKTKSIYDDTNELESCERIFDDETSEEEEEEGKSLNKKVFPCLLVKTSMFLYLFPPQFEFAFVFSSPTSLRKI